MVSNHTHSKGFPIYRSLAQMLSSGILYYIIVAMYNYFSGGIYASKPATLFILSIPIPTIMLTVIWHNYELDKMKKAPLKFNLILGPIIFLPIYFPIISAIYHPQTVPLSLWEELGSIIGGYLILPLLVTTIQQTPEGWALDLFCITVLITNELIKKRDTFTEGLT